MSYCMYWRELFEEEVSLRDIKGLYQLKKLFSSNSVYLTLKVLGNNSVTSILALKKTLKLKWFIAKDDWRFSVEHRGRYAILGLFLIQRASVIPYIFFRFLLSLLLKN